MTNPPTGPPALRDLEPGDEATVAALFDACVDWFQAATGAPSGPGDVQSLFYALPDGADPDAKRLLVIEVDGRIAGLVDVVVGWPTPDAAACGLFLMHPADRGAGVGRWVADELLRRAEVAGIGTVDITVPAGQMTGRKFLASLGFAEMPLPDRARSGNRTAWAGERDLIAARRSPAQSRVGGAVPSAAPGPNG